jgi:hypothetical protein
VKAAPFGRVGMGIGVCGVAHGMIDSRADGRTGWWRGSLLYMFIGISTTLTSRRQWHPRCSQTLCCAGATATKRCGQAEARTSRLPTLAPYPPARSKRPSRYAQLGSKIERFGAMEFSQSNCCSKLRASLLHTGLAQRHVVYVTKMRVSTDKMLSRSEQCQSRRDIHSLHTMRVRSKRQARCWMCTNVYPDT